MASTAQPFGIDFGGTGIKGAPVDLERGDFAAERVRIRTPEVSTPENVAASSSTCSRSSPSPPAPSA